MKALVTGGAGFLGLYITEQLVARAFSDHLRRGAPVSIHDDFFLDLGGNSLLAAETVSSLRKQGLTAALTVRDVYEARTVAGVASRIAQSTARPVAQEIRAATSAPASPAGTSPNAVSAEYRPPTCGSARNTRR